VGIIKEKEEFVPGRTYCIGDIVIHPFAISHDAADPVGFTFVNGSVKVGVCTDLGTATRLVHRHLEQCSVLILEANHDVEMLHNGPYPWSVKQRIRSRMGHLSNEQSVEVVARVFSNTLRQVVLAHVSETNNCAEVVQKTFNRILHRDMRTQLKITVALQHMSTQLVELV
jgi:phosphoribosyl 1,2-cyclic phosphodiesterase